MASSFDWETVLRVSGQLLVAYVLSLPIAFEREKKGRSAGLRTFPLVAMASCGYIAASLTASSMSTATMRETPGSCIVTPES